MVSKSAFRPLAMVMAPNGNLIVLNGKNGQAVEIDPATGETLGARWINANPAQYPPGSGNLFGIAMRPDGNNYYVSDDVNIKRPFDDAAHAGP